VSALFVLCIVFCMMRKLV